MIEFTVLGGYLGTGKTTLLNHLLEHNEGRRFALLINDFGDINIDAELIASTTEKQINLANGCVCCTLSDGFFEALETLQALDPPPDHVIVEASGVADVQNLAQYGHGHEFNLAGVVVLADAESVRAKAQDKYVAQTVQRQLRGADLIVLNKTDLCSGTELTEIEAWLAELTPAVPVVRATFGRVPLAVLLSVDPSHRQPTATPHTHERYVSWSWQARQQVVRERLEDFTERLPAATLRAKGVLAAAGGGTLTLQAVGPRRQIDWSDTPRQTSELVVIGLQAQLDLEALDRLAARYLEVS